MFEKKRRSGREDLPVFIRRDLIAKRIERFLRFRNRKLLFLFYSCPSRFFTDHHETDFVAAFEI